jgi:hypothetical protein
MTGSRYSKSARMGASRVVDDWASVQQRIVAGAWIGRPPEILIRRLDSKSAIANPVHECFFLATIDLDHRAVDIVC